MNNIQSKPYSKYLLEVDEWFWMLFKRNNINIKINDRRDPLPPNPKAKSLKLFPYFLWTLSLLALLSDHSNLGEHFACATLSWGKKLIGCFVFRTRWTRDSLGITLSVKNVRNELRHGEKARELKKIKSRRNSNAF